MLIVCPNCQSSYRVSAESLGVSGRTVRCAKCNTAWFAEPEDDQETSEETTAIVAENSAEEPLYGETVDPRMTRLARVMASIRHEQQDSAGEATPAEAPAKRKTPRRRFWPTAAAMAAVAIIGGLILGRDSVVRLLPQTAQLYALAGLDVNLRGLEFRDVAATERVEGGVPILLVSGKVENITDGVVDVPRLRLAVRNTDGREIYVWTVVPRPNRLVAGDTLAFQGQLASPPAEARDIAVRFYSQHDALAGVR
ncbi:thioredoxin [Agaricicola taiwanensis]|uniref:Thioredoxin n=1 Tax=Agaricicola taiwanensis TaxID=591372 RepID=A0A8J2YLJ8_9RHOB|nr:MJ0042-type zinc finger domain-containing protein [Agaricicola taiwanensis]GGE51127.1 thioredoxin [Agaricicola taiwanensis]